MTVCVCACVCAQVNILSDGVERDKLWHMELRHLHDGLVSCASTSTGHAVLCTRVQTCMNALGSVPVCLCVLVLSCDTCVQHGSRHMFKIAMLHGCGLAAVACW